MWGRNVLNKKCILITFILTFVLIFVVQQNSTRIYYHFNPEKSISCYRTKNLPRLEEISEESIRKDKSIFFHETSCRSYFNNLKTTILPRQACAIESAARMNPNYDVYLMFTSPGDIKFEGTESDRMLQRLLEYKNIFIRHLDVETYTKNTPLEKLYSNQILDYSKYAQSHASDILRYLTLFKFGGIYLDADVVVIKSLENLKPNYAGLESSKDVAAGVLSFSSTGIGHMHAESAIRDLESGFSQRDWGANGPGVITRLLKKLCNVTSCKQMRDKTCHGFKVYSPHMFYPVAYGAWTYYFDPNHTQTVLDKAKDSYVIHVWNKLSEEKKIPVDIETGYTHYARKFCPKVYSECADFF